MIRVSAIHAAIVDGLGNETDSKDPKENLGDDAIRIRKTGLYRSLLSGTHQSRRDVRENRIETLINPENS